MLEIKFRAWDERNKSYTYSGFGEKTFTIFVKRVNVPRYKIEQYTGLKDKNGKEIYAGDIVRYIPPKEGGMIICDWEDDNPYVKYIGWDKDEAEFNFFGRKKEVQTSGHTFCKNNLNSIYEVIGNIHENPELLGG